MVSDQTGALVVGARATISNASGVVRTTASDDKGNYLVKDLPPGSYAVKVAAPGFKDFVADFVNLAAGVELPLDAGLEPAGEKTEVNESGVTASTVETETAELSGDDHAKRGFHSSFEWPQLYPTYRSDARSEQSNRAG